MSETRKDNILQILQEHKNQWVNGDKLATVDTGGNRFGARIKELRRDGWNIESRKNPDPRFAQWQYRLISADITAISKPGFWACTMCGDQVAESIAMTWQKTIDNRYVMGKCTKCKKSRLFKSLTSA